MDYYLGKHSTKVQQLADRIERDIHAGIYQEGHELPSINQLSRTHQVSRDTVFKAFAVLKDKELIDSTPGKGYYVLSQTKKILLLLDEYSPFKTTLYNSFIRNLPKTYQVDLWFHQYNSRLFNAIIAEAQGGYSHYVVMNFNNEKLSPQLHKLPADKLLLLDFGNFEKDCFSYICQDFDEGLYQALLQLKDRFSAYSRHYFYFPKSLKHPRISCETFLRFCQQQGWTGHILTDESGLDVQPGCTYLVIRQSDVVDLIKQSRAKRLQCGRDFGLLAYNDTPAYEVIDNGITALTVDWEKMGRMAARFVLDGKSVQEDIPTEVCLRASL